MIVAKLRNLFNLAPSQEGVDAFTRSAGGGDKEEVIEFLRKYGSAFIDEKNDVGNTALMCAVMNERRDIVDLLLEKGADTAERGGYGQTFFMLASRNGYGDLVEALLKKGTTDINAKNQNDYTALMTAATHGHTDVVSLLLENGAHINRESDSGWTALMLAARYGYADTAALLLEKGADIDKKDYQGKTALMIAREHDENEENGEVIDLLLKWPELEKQRLADDIADFSPALKRDILLRRPPDFLRKGRGGPSI